MNKAEVYDCASASAIMETKKKPPRIPMSGYKNWKIANSSEHPFINLGYFNSNVIYIDIYKET